jgi:response regulator of citrate/malate metabolism
MPKGRKGDYMRRDPLEIMEKILRMLEREREAMSINQIAQKTGIHNVTVRRYVRIMELVRHEPLDIIQTRHSIIIRCEKRRKPEREEEE